MAYSIPEKGPGSWHLAVSSSFAVAMPLAMKMASRVFRGRVNREVQTVNWEAGKKGAVETGVKSSLKKAQKPWIRGKKAHKPWIREGLNREVQTVN